MSATSILRRVGAQILRHRQCRAGGGSGWPHGSFWSEGTQTGLNGFLYGEVPPPPGLHRKVAAWEPVWVAMWAAALSLGYVVYNTKPKEMLNMKYWARPRAAAELETDMHMLDKLQSRPDLYARLKAIADKLNLVEEEVYDLVLMRLEYKVLLGLHDGRVPPDLREIYDELAA